MNKIKAYIYISCMLFITAGCTDEFVDLTPLDKITPDVIYSNLEGIEGSLPGIYSQGREYTGWEDGCEYKWGHTDLEEAGTNLKDDIYYNAVYTLTTFDSQNTFIKNLWESLYKGLHKCNLALSSLDKLSINPNDPSLVKRRDDASGVIYFFRAYFHLNLIQRWDNIVLADHLFTDANEVIKISSKEAVYKLIISDLEKAIPLLPEASSITTDRGHITKGVARLVLAKAYMDLSEWGKAAEQATAVANDPAYGFVPLEQVFSCHFQDNKEIILSWQIVAGDPSGAVQRMSNRWLPLYDRLQGVLRSFKYGGRPYARLSPSKYYWSLFDKADKRLEAWHTLYYVYDTTNTGTEMLPPGKHIGDTVFATDSFKTENGFGPEAFTPTTKKYYEDGSLGRAIGAAEGYRNIIQYRLAEAYIIAAEAYYRAGNIPAGLPYINAIRQRAGVADFTTITDDIILEEHARELGHEGNRYEMLKRLGILVDRIKKYNPTVGPAIQPYQVRWPIPYGFQKMTKIQQNEGYE
jgi:starch-binding outer membrane protein, SusD/RagB family